VSRKPSNRIVTEDGKVLEFGMTVLRNDGKRPKREE